MLQQVAPPEELYDRRRTCSSPASSAARDEHARSYGLREERVDQDRRRRDEHRTERETLAAHPASRHTRAATIVLGIRPEGLNDARWPPMTASPGSRGHAELREALGSEVLMHFSVRPRSGHRRGP
jgi:multiple sugar transport system ATP-binding protein